MNVTLTKIGKIAFEAKTPSGHRLSMDGAPDDGGDNLGIRPMETILCGLGGCSGIDVALILNKSRQQIDACSIHIEAKRADTIPAVFTEIHLHYKIVGNNLDPGKVGRAVALSMAKYCSVTKMLEPTVRISHAFSIVESGDQ